MPLAVAPGRSSCGAIRGYRWSIYRRAATTRCRCVLCRWSDFPISARWGNVCRLTSGLKRQHGWWAAAGRWDRPSDRRSKEAVDMAPNLYEVFHQTARTWPEQPALLGPGQGEVLSYRALDEAILLASA